MSEFDEDTKKLLADVRDSLIARDEKAVELKNKVEEMIKKIEDMQKSLKEIYEGMGTIGENQVELHKFLTEKK